LPFIVDKSMWNFLKADLQELVSVVKEDAASLGIPVAEKDATGDAVDESEAQKLLGAIGNAPPPVNPTKTAAQKEVEWRMNIPETFTVPLLPEELLPKQPDDPNKDVQESAEVTEEPKESEEYDTEDDDEIKEVQDYLAAFNIDEQTDAIANALEQYPDSLRVQFETLVPEHATYQEFWERFFYRCDAVRIEQEWLAEEERARTARKQLVSNVTSFFGGAAKAVAAGVANALTEDDAGGHNATPPTGAGLGSIFGTGSGHRPPFVMNTAMDEDEDDEEEQLGWDDDDEDEEEEIVYEDFSGQATKNSASRNFDDADESEEQIEFKDVALESLKEQLKQALEERDMLHQTVELQTKEIASLKEVASNAAAATDSTAKPEVLASEGVSVVNEEAVKLLHAQIDELTSRLSDKDEQILHMKELFDNQANGLQADIDRLTMEKELLQNQMKESEDSWLIERKALEDKVSMLEDQRTALELELKTTSASLEASRIEVSAINGELEDLKRSKQTESPAAVVSDGGLSSSAETSSTGVKVPPVVTKMVTNTDTNEEEDGWGDDWD
jgi:BSD domain